MSDEYKREAQAVLEAHADHGAIAQLRTAAEELQAEAEEMIETLNDRVWALQIEENRLLEELRQECPFPPPPEVPRPEVGGSSRRDPLHERLGLGGRDATQRLRALKQYDGADERARRSRWSTFVASTISGNIRAFLSLCIGGMTIHGAKIVQQSEQRPWLAMPDRQWTAPDGKIRYSPVIELSASLKKRVNDAALGGWENALTAEPAA